MSLFLYITWSAKEEDSEEHLKKLGEAIRHERTQYPEIKSLRVYRRMFGPHGGLLGGRILGVLEIMEFENMASYEKWVQKTRSDRRFNETNEALKDTIVDGSYRIHLMTDILRDSWTERDNTE